MATSAPRTWTGTPTLTPAAATEIEALYIDALGDEDKATDPADNAYHEGLRTAYEHVLDLLHPTLTPER